MVARASFCACAACALAAAALRPLPRRAPRAPHTVRRSAVEDFADLAAAAGAGRGAAAKRRARGAHKNKYRRVEKEDAAPRDPWEAELARAAAAEAPKKAPPLYTLKLRCFEAGAAAARSRPKPGAVLDFDARDPTTFGFEELGTVVGAHGVRGALRVDCLPEALEVGLRHLKLATRRTPRPVVVAETRPLKRLGATTRHVVTLRGCDTREDAQRLAGATLYARDEDVLPADEDDDDAYAPRRSLEGRAVVDAATGGAIGTVFDVLDPHETAGASLAPPLLEIALSATRHVLVPLAPPIVPDVRDDRVVLDASSGLLELAFDYVAPAPVIKGLLEPPAAGA